MITTIYNVINDIAPPRCIEVSSDKGSKLGLAWMVQTYVDSICYSREYRGGYRYSITKGFAVRGFYHNQPIMNVQFPLRVEVVKQLELCVFSFSFFCFWELLRGN